MGAKYQHSKCAIDRALALCRARLRTILVRAHKEGKEEWRRAGSEMASIDRQRSHHLSTCPQCVKGDFRE